MPGRVLNFLFCFACAASLYASIIPTFTPPVTGNSPSAVKLRRAFAALRQQKLPEAEAEFQAALLLEPNRAEGLIGLAEIAKERRDPAREEAFLKRALEVRGGTAIAYRAWAHHLAGTNRVADAEGAFRKAAGLDPSSPDALIELGDLDLASGRRENAEKVYREALAGNPNSYEAHLGLGSALAGENRMNAAVDEFHQAIVLNPAQPAPLLSIGLAYAATGQKDKAVEAFGQALKIDPKFVQAWISRGDAYQSKGDGTRAISDYSQALKLDPRAGVVQFKIGLVYLASNKVADAEKYFHAAVEADPSVAHAWNDLAWLAASRKSNLDLALVWAKKAVSLDPKDSEFADTLAWVYRARGELDLGAKTIENFPAKDHAPVLLYHLGVIDSERGKKKEALLALQQSLAAGSFAESEQARKLMATLRP